MSVDEIGDEVSGEAPSPSAIRDALARLLASPEFDATDRIRNFLSYVVEETLQGRASRIKAYSIATSVFGRDDSFDPQIDSIVRIVAGRLRRSLEHYYLTSGRNEEIFITIPKGSYVPIFVDTIQHETAPTVREGDFAVQSGPSVGIASFAAEGDHSAFPYFVSGLERSLTVGLSRFSALQVFSLGSDEHGSEAQAARMDYILKGGVTIAVDKFWVDIILVDQRTGRTVWANSFERALNTSEVFALRNEIANQIAQTLAQPYGIISSDLSKDQDGAPPKRLSSYGCVLQFHQYWRTLDRSLLPAVRDCLERTIRRDPTYAEAFACLSLAYSNIYRFDANVVPSDADLRERALALADHAIELTPSSSWAHYARALAYWFLYDVDSSLSSFQTARSLNPNDTAIAADLGQRYAMLGDWEKAVPLLEESYARNSAQPGGYRIGLFLFHYAHGRYELALQQARKMGSLVTYGSVAVAMAAAKLGYAEEACRAIKRILALDPCYGDHVVADLEKRSLRPELITMVVDGLREAGLPGFDTGLVKKR